MGSLFSSLNLGMNMGWTQWSEWSTVTSLNSLVVEVRERSCQGKSTSCDGDSYQLRENTATDRSPGGGYKLIISKGID